jgi:hypothetical protein
MSRRKIGYYVRDYGYSAEHDMPVLTMRSFLGEAYRGKAEALPELQRARLGCSGWDAEARKAAEEGGEEEVEGVGGLHVLPTPQIGHQV